MMVVHPKIDGSVRARLSEGSCSLAASESRHQLEDRNEPAEGFPQQPQFEQLTDSHDTITMSTAQGAL